MDLARQAMGCCTGRLRGPSVGEVVGHWVSGVCGVSLAELPFLSPLANRLRALTGPCLCVVPVECLQLDPVQPLLAATTYSPMPGSALSLSLSLSHNPPQLCTHSLAVQCIYITQLGMLVCLSCVLVLFWRLLLLLVLHCPVPLSSALSLAHATRHICTHFFPGSVSVCLFQKV